MPVTDIFEAIAHYDLYGQRLMNTFHYVCIVDPTPANAANLLINGLQVVGGMQAVLREALPQDLTFLKWTAQQIYPTRRRYAVRLVNLPGQWETDSTTANVAASVTTYSDLAGRGQVGRIQVPISPDATATIAGQLTPAMTVAMTDIANHLAMSINGGEGGNIFSPVIFHRQKKDQPNVPPSYSSIFGAFPQNTTRVMTRRTVGRGI